MSDSVNLKGKLLWGESGQAVSGVTVQLYAGDGTPVGSAKSDDKGHYEMSFPSGLAGRPMHLVVTEPGARILHSTRDAAVVLHGSACQFDAIVPGAPRDRKVEALRTRDLRTLALEAKDPEVVLEIARALVAPRRAPGTKEPLKILSTASIERSLCGTPVLEAIEEAIRTKGWPREIAHQVDDILAMRGAGFATATYVSANFSVTYQTSGTAAVPSSTATETVLDPGTTAALATIGDGTTPTYILRIVFWLERALAAYVAPPFSMKNPALAGKIPVVINTSPYGSASPSGTFYLNNNLPADLICAVGVHELFHMVQFQYGTGTGPWRSSIVEGGAVFAEDSAADKMNRYLDEAARTSMVSAPRATRTCLSCRPATSAACSGVTSPSSSPRTSPSPSSASRPIAM
jgi:hypothetical protein